MGSLSWKGDNHVQNKPESRFLKPSRTDQDLVINPFDKACLIQLRTSCWTGAKNLNPRVLGKIGKSDWLKGKKLLVGPERLSPIKTTIHRARQVLNEQALPFPITGLSLVPKESLTQVDVALERFKNEFWKRVEEFLSDYDQARSEAKGFLGEDLFNESDYPLDIRGRFRFNWRFLTIQVPGKASVLPPELYDREKRKFQSLMEETREMAITALAKELGDLVTTLVDRLSGSKDGKPKKLQSSMVNKLNEFLESFDDRNFFNDDRLTELVEQAKVVTNGISPYSLRYNQELRDQFAKSMTSLKENVEKAIEDLPVRKLRLDKAA